MGPSYEMDDNVFEGMVSDVAEDFNIPPERVNDKVSDLILQSSFDYKQKKKHAPEDYSKQCNYGAILEDAALIVRNMRMRVDFLSEYGLTRIPEVQKLKDDKKVRYGIGPKTAERIVQIIKNKGEVKWVMYSTGFMDLKPL